VECQSTVCDAGQCSRCSTPASTCSDGSSCGVLRRLSCTSNESATTIHDIFNGQTTLTTAVSKQLLGHCWLGDRKGIRPVKSWVFVVTIWPELWCLIAPAFITTSVILSANKIQNGDILVSTNPGSPGKWPLKQRERERERESKQAGPKAQTVQRQQLMVFV